MNVALLLSLGCSAALSGAALYEADFTDAEVGQVPEGLMVIDGQFAVQEADGNRFLELPGSPLETFGVLFGPSEKAGLVASGRIQATRKGRLYPAFSISVGGVSGFKLQVSPAKKAVELLKADAPLVAQPYEWVSGTWTRLRLQLRLESEGNWVVEGKVWPDGGAEPQDWTIRTRAEREPVAGKSGVWGKPFSGTPIWFDDLKVERLAEK